jgi:ribosome-associated protein
MPRPDELQRTRRGGALAGGGSDDAPAPSKTQVKREMLALQHLGEELVRLDAGRFAALAREVELPERLVDAVAAARTITAWGARKRQLQFIGKLMRDQDPAPIRRRLDVWAQGRDANTERQRTLERWRERLLDEADAQEALAAEFPAVDRSRLRSLVARAHDEKSRGGPPHAYRELYRMLKSLAAEAE